MQGLSQFLYRHPIQHGRTEAANRVLEPYFEMIVKRCANMDIGLNRWGAEAAWG